MVKVFNVFLKNMTAIFLKYLDIPLGSDSFATLQFLLG